MKAAIVGSGTSACACAVRLKEKGVDFTVFEKECIPRQADHGEDRRFIIEGGPDSFLPENVSLRS